MRENIIKPLLESVKSSVRSGILVFDLTRVVEELIFNSLDAGATKISVAVGVGTGYIKVADNGSGITRDGLVLLGERYATSKFNQFGDIYTTTGSFGSRGEALGSISDVSLLEIVTKAHGMPNGYRKVMKGCKCLYLGIDDSIQGAGTTVIVRDLFYNQPVRRKQLQSRKVLHSLKECVLRFALVHLKVSFKVVDVESEDELLCTHPSSTPFSLLMSGFGIEVASSLHEFNVSDGILKLSGYISDPCEALSGKAVQYVYINFRFVCKGPIHKLLSQLAAKFICLDLPSDGSHSGKRSKIQSHPSYILNLGCPQSFYDLTFDPSKTSAEFKDWDHILLFVEKAITNVWNKNASNGNCLSHGADMFENDDMRKEGGNTFIAEDETADCGMKRKRNRTQFYHTSLDLPPPQPKILLKEFKHLSPCRSNRVSCLNSSKKLLEFDEQQKETGFSSETKYSFHSHDGVFSPCRDTADKENRRNLELPDGSVSSVDHYFLESEFSTERSIGNVDLISDTGRNGVSLELDADMSDILTSNGGLSADCFEVGRDVEEITGTLKEEKSFLQSCSSEKNLLLDREFSTRDRRLGFQFNKLENHEKWFGHVDGSDEGEINSSSKRFDSWEDERARIWSSPRRITQDDMYMDPYIPERDSIRFRPIMRQCFNEGKELCSQEYSPKHVSFRSNRSCLTPNLFVKNLSMEYAHFMDEDFVEKNFNNYSYSTDREDKDCISSYGSTQYNFGWGNGSISRCMESVFKDCGRSQNDICYFHIDNPDYDSFSKCFDEYSDEIKLSGRDAYGNNRNMTDIEPSHNISSAICFGEDKHQMAQIRCQGKAYGKRQKRSHSAPPIYRGKKKFLASNSGLILESGNTQIATTFDATTLKENCDMKHLKQLADLSHPSSRHPSVLDSLDDSRLDTKTTNKKKVQICEMQTGCQDVHINMDFEEIMAIASYSQVSTSTKEGDLLLKFSPMRCYPSGYSSEKIPDSLTSAIKWRSSCRNASGETSVNLYNKGAKILDISSGLLHLVGDSLVPKSVTMDCLKGAKVLQQIDKKYIPVVGSGVLAVIDQHAADERIRLEELRQKVLSGDMKTITYLDEEQQLVLPEIGHQLLHNYAEQIQNWGWICNINVQSSRSFKKNLKLLLGQSSSITLLAVPCILGVNLNDADLLEFLQQLADTDGSSAIPPSVLRVLNFKACRGAIMFGDALLPSECSLIVEELKQTSLCFQCAHGRPTTVPLVNLHLLHKQIAKLGQEGNGSIEVWHGLRRHEATLERAAQRLN